MKASAKAKAIVAKSTDEKAMRVLEKEPKAAEVPPQEEKPQGPPDGAARPLDEDFLCQQRKLGAQSCRGVGTPDLSPLGGDKHAHQVFSEMLRRERALAGDFAVFYHSYNSPALIYEAQAAVAKVLFRFSAKHGVLPRLLKKPFENIPDAAAMLKAFPTWPDRDHNPAFKSVGICCSTNLASTDPEATPTHVFLHGYGASSVSIHVIEQLLKNCGTPKKHISLLATKIMDLAKKHGLPQATGSGQQGHLLQIFIHRSCVDKWAYASLPYGVLDKPRQPLSKHLAKDCQMVGQARVVVNPSAFMRAQTVRLHAYSADPTFHKNRHRFQEELFEVLAPILGSPEVRQTAAAGIYGGKLPSWWKDFETEKKNESYEAEAKKNEDLDSSSPAAPRTKCRYGAECIRKGAEHRSSYAHPGDSDWDSPSVPVTTASAEPTPSRGDHVEGDDAEAKQTREASPVAPRMRCRYGAECRRSSAEHRGEFSHPGDSDWDRPILSVATKPAELANAAGKSSRQCCRHGAQCYRKGAEHRSAYAHPGDDDWEEAGRQHNESNEEKATTEHEVPKVSEESSACLAADVGEHMDSNASIDLGEQVDSIVSANIGKQMDAGVWDEAPLATSITPTCVEDSNVSIDIGQQMDADAWDDVKGVASITLECVKGSDETRYDPEIGKDVTLEQLMTTYEAHYIASEIVDYWGTLFMNSAAAVAPGSPSGYAVLALDTKTKDFEQECIESVPGLLCWLAELNLSKYGGAAKEWTQRNGACSLEEIVENVDDFISDVGFKKVECKRIRKNLESGLHAASAA